MASIAPALVEDDTLAKLAIRFTGLWGGHVATAFDADTAAGRNTPKKIAFEAATSEIYEDS